MLTRCTPGMRLSTFSMPSRMGHLGLCVIDLLGLGGVVGVVAVPAPFSMGITFEALPAQIA